MAAYSLIGLPYAFVLGIIAGIFELLPYIGPVLGAILTVAATQPRHVCPHYHAAVELIGRRWTGARASATGGWRSSSCRFPWAKARSKASPSPWHSGSRRRRGCSSGSTLPARQRVWTRLKLCGSNSSSTRPWMTVPEGEPKRSVRGSPH